MLKELKSPQKDSSAWCSLSDKLQMAEDCLAAVRKGVAPPVFKETVVSLPTTLGLDTENINQRLLRQQQV